MASKFNTYENQAKLSVGLAAVGGLALVAVVMLIIRNFDATTFYTSYDTRTMWLPIFGVALLVGLLAGTVGFFVGLNSAGQRRNTLSGLAWKGFFLNAALLTALLVALLFFYFTHYPVRPAEKTAGAPPAALQPVAERVSAPWAQSA